MTIWLWKKKQAVDSFDKKPSMQNLTALASLIGGLLIGLSASAMLLFDGKITGISGIFAGILSPTKGDTVWKVCFLAGLIVGGVLLRLFLPHAFDFGVVPSWGVLALAGLLVGVGARLGNGCTSGHGICGVSRLSARSIVATVTFVASGAVVVFVVNHLCKVSL
jgi:uncharacterized membrane protein YedE/YeeE